MDPRLGLEHLSSYPDLEACTSSLESIVFRGNFAISGSQPGVC